MNYFFKADHAIIEEDVSVGSDSKIWYFSHVSKGAKIGKNCNLGDHVFIGKSVIIGNDVRIGNNSSVCTGAIIKDRVFIGPNVVFTNVRKPRANKKARKYLDTIVENGVSIEAGAIIQGGVKIGENTIVGAGAVVISDLPANSFCAGNPVKVKKQINEEA